MGWSEVVREFVRASRALRHSPGFAVVAILTLALGIGANTAVFSVLDAALFSELPYENPDRLVRLYDIDPDDGDFNYLRTPALLEWREWDDILESVGVVYTYREVGADLTGGSQPQRITISPVGAGYFETLGIAPLFGRTFDQNDEVAQPFEAGGIRAGSARAILSEELWRARFGGDRSVLGTTIELDGAPYEIIGVMPAGFQNPIGSQAQLWVPQDLDPTSRWNGWGNWHLSAVARIPEGVTVEEVNRRLMARHTALVEEVPDAEGTWFPHVEPLQADLVGATRRTLLWILFGAVGMVLLSACVNVANLFLARSLSRNRELAVRASLGSGRSRLVLHLVSEAAVLSVIGGALGLVAGWAGLKLLLGVAPDALPTFSTPSLNPRVLLFTGVIAVGTAFLFALVPALRLSRPDIAGSLREGGRGTGSEAMNRLRDGLVVAEAAVALVLVVGAGLLARSFAELQEVRLGVEPEGVLTFEVHLPNSRYADGASREAAHATLQRELEAHPEIAAAGAVSWLPVNGTYNSWGVAWSDSWSTAGGVQDDGSEDWFQTEIRIFRGNYFESMGIDLLLGEAPSPLLSPEGENQVWVTRRFVERIFEPSGADPIGQPVWVGNAERRVAGVVEDLPLDPQGTTRVQTFIPHAQFADDRNWALIQTVALRPGTDPRAARSVIEAAVDRIDRDLVVFRPRPYEEILDSRMAQDRFAALLMALFAGLALTLAAVGTYGVLSYAVGRRRREIGIRMALGATAGSVRGMVLRYGFRLLGGGLLLGLAGAWLTGQWIESLLFGVQLGDPTAWIVGPSMLVLVGFLAGWIPAMRATRVDPARTLTTE